MALCHFYGWKLADVRALTVAELRAARQFMEQQQNQGSR